MKKIIALLAVLFLLQSVALADPDLQSYNFFASTYGAPTIDESSLIENTSQRVTYRQGKTTLAFAAVNSLEINSAFVVSEPDGDFLPTCVAAAMTLNPSSENTTSSLGFLLYAYLMIKNGEESYMGFFGGLVFTMKKDGDRFQFAIGKV